MEPQLVFEGLHFQNWHLGPIVIDDGMNLMSSLEFVDFQPSFIFSKNVYQPFWVLSYSCRNELDNFRHFFPPPSISTTVERTNALRARRGGSGVSFPAKTRDERRDGANAMATTVSQLANNGTSARWPLIVAIDSSDGMAEQQGAMPPNLRRSRRFSIFCWSEDKLIYEEKLEKNIMGVW